MQHHGRQHMAIKPVRLIGARNCTDALKLSRRRFTIGVTIATKSFRKSWFTCFVGMPRDQSIPSAGQRLGTLTNNISSIEREEHSRRVRLGPKNVDPHEAIVPQSSGRQCDRCEVELALVEFAPEPYILLFYIRYQE
jgi:hypothetical protein